MRVSTSLSRAGLDLASSTTSRIPHLRLHILARQPRSKIRSPPVLTRNRQERWLHSSPRNLSSLSSLNEDAQDLHQEPCAEEIESARPSSLESDAPETKYSQLHDILQERHPERVLFALLDPSLGHSFVQRADPTAFTSALTALDPHYLIEPIKEVYRFIKPSLTSDPTYRWVRHIGSRFESFSVQLYTIVGLRREAGRKLTLDDYRHLLDCARCMGHVPMAKQMMWKMMKEDGVEPDLHCYNHFMEAHCWSHAWSKSEQWRLRVTPRILQLRSRYQRRPDLKGHRTGPSGLRYKMLALFKEMVVKGFKADESTFTTLMTAMGRENDLAGAKSILRSVYNVDVDLLQQVDEEEVETPTFYENDSPLRPSAQLLFTIAHVWGSNNEPALAYTLVDYLSRQYDIQIPFRVWMQLVEWTFVLGLRRSGAEIRQGQDLGQVSHEMLETLWEAMTDAPHYVGPDNPMLTMRARAKRDVLELDETMTILEDAREKLDAGRRQLLGLSEQVMDWIHRWIKDARTDDILTTEWYELRRAFIMGTLETDRDLQLLITASRQVFTEFHWPEFAPPEVRRDRGHPERERLWREFSLGYQSRLLEWERRRLPSLLDGWGEYFPNSLLYKTSGGYIAINGKKHRTGLLEGIWESQMRKNGIVRAAIDTDNYNQMIEGMRRLPGVMEGYEQYCFVCETADHKPEDCTAQSGVESDSLVVRSGSDLEMTRMRGSHSYFVTDAITWGSEKNADPETSAPLRRKTERALDGQGRRAQLTPGKRQTGPLEGDASETFLEGHLTANSSGTSRAVSPSASDSGVPQVPADGGRA